MFVAIREIKSARGRFGLMVGVVALVALLLVVLTALTRGLGNQSTSAVEALPGRIAVAGADGKTSFDTSVLPGSVTGNVLGIGHGRVAHGGSTAPVAVFGRDGIVGAGGVELPRATAAGLGVSVGDTVTAGERKLRVDRVTDDTWYSHSPVITVPTSEFSTIVHQPARTALLLEDGQDAPAGTTAMTPSEAVAAIPGYSSEHGSLLLIQGFLYAISALVVVAFVSVWTVQRTRDLAVMRALGASRRTLLTDSLGQAGVLLVSAVALGTVLAAAALFAIGDAAPVLRTADTFILPVAGIVGLGLIGSYVATRRVTRVDPLLALGGN